MQLCLRFIYTDQIVTYYIQKFDGGVGGTKCNTRDGVIASKTGGRKWGPQFSLISVCNTKNYIVVPFPIISNHFNVFSQINILVNSLKINLVISDSNH